MKTECPRCLKEFPITPEVIGKKATCKICGNVFLIEERKEKRTPPAPLAPVPSKTSAEQNAEIDFRMLKAFVTAVSILLFVFSASIPFVLPYTGLYKDMEAKREYNFSDPPIHTPRYYVAIVSYCSLPLALSLLIPIAFYCASKLHEISKRLQQKD